ncbi:MAG: YcjF family protein [Hyphomicrobiaceae bacterium]
MNDTPRDRRRPRAFDSNDPALRDVAATAPVEPAEESAAAAPSESVTEADGPPEDRATVADRRRGIGWGSLLLSSLTGLFLLGLGAWFMRLVSAALAREDWVGWTAYGLAIMALVSAGVLLTRELVGLMRLNRLAGLKRDLSRAISERDAKAERSGVGRLASLYAGRPELRWGLARFAEHRRDVHDAGGLARLAERELMSPLDAEARRQILKSAKRVSVVTALSPVFFFAVIYVLVENVRMLRGLATLYGGRPGLMGALRLGRMVITHIIATGGLALTDDLLGQFLGQDLVRRLSRRLGEGLFNGALTARVGAAAVDVSRPLPFLEQQPVRVRDLVGELVRRTREERGAAAAREKSTRRID